MHHVRTFFFLLEISWRKLQLKGKLINCFLFPLTLKGMSKPKTARRGSLEAYFTVQILFPGILVMLYVTFANISHPISTDRKAENGKHTLFSPDLTSVPVCVVFIFCCGLIFSPLGTVPLLIYFFFVLLFSHKLRSVSENHAFPNNVTTLLGSLGNKWL